ncbi:MULTISPECIES: NADH-quinone oxidoreductase subunit NuoN [unclassified Acinetobacter]|uniref:NADH-quinone oxidoreductase subunit NuoN n=1 Tax=unclassified Acinetobacter TaxID=196816 RepID=UPI0035BA51C0
MNFTISFSQLLPLVPVMIVALTTIIVMLLVSLKRHHDLAATASVLGLNIAALWLVKDLYLKVPSADVMGLFTVDSFARVFMLMVVIASLACMTLSHAYLSKFKDNKEELYILLLASVTGAMLMVSSTHYASFFMSLELMSIPVYGMLAYTYHRQRSLESGIKYLVLSATASAMLLMGMAYLYAYTGEMSFAISAMEIVKALHEPLVVIGLGLTIFAVAFKLSLAPFHKWTADVYQGAPAPMATFLASAAKVATLGLFLRYVYTSGALVLDGVMTVLTVIAILSVFLGNLLALNQNNLKRILAYSSIAHFGYVLIALVSTDISALAAINTYIISYVLTTIGAFGVIALMSSPFNHEAEAETLEDYRGLFWRRPVLTATLTVMLLSLAGIPLTAGFVAKFMIVLQTVAVMNWWLAGVIIIGSGIGLYYYLRVLAVLYMAPIDKPNLDAEKHWGKTAGGIMVLVAALLVLVLGVYPEPMLKVAEFAKIEVLQ